jgi:hypothetical protein
MPQMMASIVAIRHHPLLPLSRLLPQSPNFALPTSLYSARPHSALSSAPEEPLRTPHPNSSSDLSEQEWDIRTGARCSQSVFQIADLLSAFTGRAIDHLRRTLPDFFSTGLITHVTPDENLSQSSSSSLHAPSKSLSAISTDPNRDSLPTDDCPILHSIYSPKVRLSYTPPTALPSPFPRTLHVEGAHRLRPPMPLLILTYNVAQASRSTSLPQSSSATRSMRSTRTSPWISASSSCAALIVPTRRQRRHRHRRFHRSPTPYATSACGAYLSD